MGERKGRGSVSVQSIKGRLRLAWRADGKRYFLSLGYPDTAMHQKIASMKAAEIERDLLYERFDPSLSKYKGDEKPKPEKNTAEVSLPHLWQKYTEYNRSQLKPSTISTNYRQVGRTIAKLPTSNPYEAIAVRDWALSNLTVDAVRRLMMQLGACCDWAHESGLLTQNSFKGLAAKIKVPKGKTEEQDINPFTVQERDHIIAAFENSRYYSYYAPLVKFLFATGCRPSEALGLQWKHINKGMTAIRFEQALTETEEGLQIVEGLKTQERRSFPCNEKLKDLLKQIKQVAQDKDRASDNDLVFPSPKGRYLNFHNFGQRGWAAALNECKIEFRKAYQMRHTFITLALANGLAPQDVAKLVGTSPKMIYEHYAGVTRSLTVPDF